MSPKSQIMLARADHEAASRKYAATVAAVCPIGSHVYYERGNGKIEGEVIGINEWAWWNEPGVLDVRNLKTGKVSKVSPHADSFRIISTQPHPAKTA